MAKRKKLKTKKSQQKPTESIGGIVVNEESIPKKEEEVINNTPAKILERVTSEKIVAAPQTYTEDTFDLDNQKTDKIVIENEIKKKNKRLISKEDLYNLATFKSKLARIKARVELEKSFAFLFDFVVASKAFKIYTINEIEDEFDILLYEVVIHFKKRLARINLPYKEYQLVDKYFESLKTLYGKFKNRERVDTEKLVTELDEAKKLHNLITLRLFI